MENELILVFFLAVIVVWFWIDALRAHEMAVKRCEQACRHIDMQFLDQTVVLKRMGLKRNGHGRVLFRREYSFEYSSIGDDRYSGLVVMLGRYVQSIELGSCGKTLDS